MMKLCEYKNIIAKYHATHRRRCFSELLTYFPDVPLETLRSICVQDIQRRIKRVFYCVTSPRRIAEYYQKYQKNTKKQTCGFLLELADKIEFSPALLASHFLEFHYNQKTKENSGKPENNDGTAPQGIEKQELKDLLSNTSLIEDGQLAAEIQMCVLSDEVYGPISDIIKQAVGDAYEDKLQKELEKLEVPYVDENYMRMKGYDKTPDVKLEKPIAVGDFVVNWIESKASFGDPERHKEYLHDQYWCYINRYGPGLVIYWFGYIEEFNINQDDGLLIMDSFPTDIVLMNY